jgi:hypothetical protein
MMRDKLVGPKVRLILQKFLPSKFEDEMMMSPSSAVSTFEGTVERKVSKLERNLDGGFSAYSFPPFSPPPVLYALRAAIPCPVLRVSLFSSGFVMLYF